MLKRFLFVCGICLFSLAACKYEGDVINVINGATYEENKNFETRGVPLLVGSDDNAFGVVYLRFYDGNEYVPYIGLKYWLEYSCDMKISGIDYSNGEYTITGMVDGKSFPIVVNTKNSTMYCPAWRGFTQADSNLYFGNSKMISSFKTFFGQNSITFDLAKYGFKIYAGLDDAYVPLCVVNQLITCTIKNLQVIFNGKNFYVYTPSSNFDYFYDSTWYNDLNKRPQKLIDVTYNMLCFTHDYIYGKPGYYGFADAGKGRPDEAKVKLADSLSFDEMLTQYDPNTKALLKASSYKDYLKGLVKLTRYTYGDEHANIHWADFIIFNNAEIKAAIDEIRSNGESPKWEYDNQVSAVSIPGSLNYCRKQKGIIDNNGAIQSDKVLELIDGGKTLIIRFDVFEVDQSGSWNTYYDNAFAEPDPTSVDTIPDDTVGLFYRAFYYIKNRKTVDGNDYSNVKTVLIDVSCNGGGAKPVLQWILFLITGRGDLPYEDVHTGSKYYEYTKADLNLDGKVDNDDVTYREFVNSLNIAVMSSFNSFSCGNALPYFAKERGITIIGEESGGGSCTVGSGVTADGFPFNFSSNQRLCSEDFSKTVEGGAPVDYELKNGDSYENFYDNDSLIAALKEVFQENY